VRVPRFMAESACRCATPHRNPVLVVVTGAPGSGKTAVLELMRHVVCEHVHFLPGAMHIVLRGKFPRFTSGAGRRAFARAIFGVQRELERMAVKEGTAAVIVCDRGTVDGAAYWPSDLGSFFLDNGTTLAAEMARYGGVIDLRISPARIADPTNAARIEPGREAGEVDATILSLWNEHPHRYVIDGDGDFLDRAVRAVAVLDEIIPACCRKRRAPAVTTDERVARH
jgi:predicted ATPase